MPLNTDTGFPFLDALIGGTFHQDVHMYGDTLEEIIDAYKREAMPNEAEQALSEINVYLAAHPKDEELTRHFYQTFYPQIEEGTFGTVRESLTKVAALLS